jgi:hypothetical protein
MAEGEEKEAGGRIMVRVTLSLTRHLKFDPRHLKFDRRGIHHQAQIEIPYDYPRQW